MSFHHCKIFIGDFNLTLNNQLVRCGSHYNNFKAVSMVEEMMDKLCLTDVWRDRNGSDFRFSFYVKKQNKIVASGIDFVLSFQG